MRAVSKADVEQIVVEFISREKNVNDIAVSSVEQKDGVWVISGTCPIDLEGHPWTERFEVAVDEKGRIRSSYFSLL